MTVTCYAAEDLLRLRMADTGIHILFAGVLELEPEERSATASGSLERMQL